MLPCYAVLHRVVSRVGECCLGPAFTATACELALSLLVRQVPIALNPRFAYFRLDGEGSTGSGRGASKRL